MVQVTVAINFVAHENNGVSMIFIFLHCFNP